MSDKRYTKKCPECGNDFIAKIKKAIYCSERCRAMAGRRRRGSQKYKPTGRPPGRPRKYPKGTSGYVPTGRPRGRPRKDPAPAPILVPDPALPPILVLESTKLRHEEEFKKLVKKSMEAQDIKDRESAKYRVEIVKHLMMIRDNAKTHEDWCNAKWALDNLFY
ncbi:unnamed protein product [marine sediment metagenome]|uniref:DUF2116 family Zn-ribbon domain-containing protein n=1 Tax=marine sediment metagenome TaxID=412755 RepID=X1DYA7_9ZZZZ